MTGRDETRKTSHLVSAHQDKEGAETVLYNSPSTNFCSTTMSERLAIGVFAMIYIKEDCRVGILEIEKHPIAAGDAKRKRVRKRFQSLDMQTRVAPVLFETVFLNMAEPLNPLWDIAECAFKISRADYLHSGAGGYCLIAFSYERRMRRGCIKSSISSYGSSKANSERRRRTSSRMSLRIFGAGGYVFVDNVE